MSEGFHRGGDEMAKWDLHWKREYPLWYGAASMQGLAQWIKEETGETVPTRGLWRDGWFAIYSAAGSKKAVEESLRLKFAKDSGFVKQLVARIEKNGAAFVETAKALQMNIPDKDLFLQAQEYFDAYVDFCADMFLSLYIVRVVSAAFQKLVLKEVPEKAAEVIASYSIASGQTTLAHVNEFLVSDASEKMKVEFLQRTYPFMNNIDPFTEPITNEEIRAYVQNFTAPSEKKVKRSQLTDTALVAAYQDVLYLKDKRDDYRRESFYHAVPFMREIAKRLSVTLKELGLLIPAEYSKDVKRLVRDRRQGIKIVYDKGFTITSGEVEDFLSAGVGETEVHGIVANPGKIRGYVQQIRTRKDIARFEQGKVLVAITISPEHIVAMQKATAIVTDEGGIACHAAIVAREMDKPCIVGTGKATSVFKDGDLVEVDAEKGIVRRC